MLWNNESGPEKYGECRNGVPWKVGTYQEVKANLTGRYSEKTNEPKERVRRYKIEIDNKFVFF